MRTMNKNYIYCGVSFLAGLVIGGVLVYEAIKAKKRADENKEIEKELNEDLEGVFEDEYPSDRDSENVMYTPEEITENERREALLKNWNKPPIGKGATLEEEMAESEHPMDSDEDENENFKRLEDDSPSYNDEMNALEKSAEADKFYKEHKEEPPRIISEDDASDLPAGIEKVEWIFWDKDEIITNEEEEVIEDFKRFVGDCLDEFMYDSNDETILVLSYEFMSLYSVTRYFLSYTEKKEGDERYYEDLRSNYE